MSLKTSADVLIGGKIYTLSGYESEEYLQKVASYINSKISEIEELEQFRRLQADMKSTLLELNIADDYFKAKEQAEKLEQAVREKEREIYELQHDLISAKIRIESSEKNANELEQENKELLLNKAKLEASLADALLGKVKGQVSAGHEPREEEKEPEQSMELEKQEILKKSFPVEDKQKHLRKNNDNGRVTQEI
ncbi:cell division protein ZapA [Lachnospiraceae bacterium 66-29]